MPTEHGPARVHFAFLSLLKISHCIEWLLYIVAALFNRKL